MRTRQTTNSSSNICTRFLIVAGFFAVSGIISAFIQANEPHADDSFVRGMYGSAVIFVLGGLFCVIGKAQDQNQQRLANNRNTVWGANASGSVVVDIPPPAEVKTVEVAVQPK